MALQRQPQISGGDADAVVRDPDQRFAAVGDRNLDPSAPASMAFSTSSFTAEAGRSTTSPAAIRLAAASERRRIGDGSPIMLRW